ncbi:protease complex subunit PrcB family protein [Winogradskyella wichelsiae]|uniref:protease complex subunit PrcB family protein n=1 Tax=Winogradskyella wichelsiae TaxID=2697007 RepID=UPI003EFAA4AB
MMKVKLIILFAIGLFGCKTSQNSTKMKAIEPILIAKGNLHGSGSEGIKEQNIIIDNQSDWDNLIHQINTVNNVSDGFLETKIDFTDYTIIAIFTDVKNSGGHKIDVDVITTDKEVLVTVNHVGPSGMATSVMTQPYYIAKISKSDLPIVFK